MERFIKFKYSYVIMKKIEHGKEDLESRLKGVNTPDIKESLIFHLKNRDYAKAACIDNPYFKYNLVDAIIDNINQYASTEPKFKSNLNSTLNKDEAKRVFYGLVCIESYDSGLSKVIAKLTDWEKVCFFAGVWDKREMEDINSKYFVSIVKDYIKAGYDLLNKKHMIHYNEGDYKRPIKIPGSQDYHKKQGNNEKKQLSFDF